MTATDKKIQELAEQGYTMSKCGRVWLIEDSEGKALWGHDSKKEDAVRIAHAFLQLEGRGRYDDDKRAAVLKNDLFAPLAKNSIKDVNAKGLLMLDYVLNFLDGYNSWQHAFIDNTSETGIGYLRKTVQGIAKAIAEEPASERVKRTEFFGVLADTPICDVRRGQFNSLGIYLMHREEHTENPEAFDPGELYEELCLRIFPQSTEKALEAGAAI